MAGEQSERRGAGTSNKALWLESLPRLRVRLALGGIGVEVTIVARSLMPQEEPEVGTALLAAFEARGIRLVRGRVVGLARAAATGRSRWCARTALRPRCWPRRCSWPPAAS